MPKMQNTYQGENIKNTNDEVYSDNLLVPKMDIVFQTLFSKGHENITIPLISSIINEEIDSIDMDVKTHLTRKHVKDKLGILDFRARLRRSVHIAILRYSYLIKETQ